MVLTVHHVGTRCLQVKNIVIATGGQASRIPIPGAEHAIISDEVRLSSVRHPLAGHQQTFAQQQLVPVAATSRAVHAVAQQPLARLSRSHH
jgi:hypothetical protein